MVTGFYRTPEGVKQYEALLLEYENSPDDNAYDDFLRITAKCPKEKRRREILQLTRKVVGSGSKARQYLLWNQKEIAYTGIGEERSYFRGRCGTYPIPIALMARRRIPDTLESEEYVSGIKEVRTGYTTLFTPKNLDSFLVDCNNDDTDRPTEFAIEVGHTRYAVDDVESFRNGEIFELQKLGHIANPNEKKRLDDEIAGKIPPSLSQPKPVATATTATVTTAK